MTIVAVISTIGAFTFLVVSLLALGQRDMWRSESNYWRGRALRAEKSRPKVGAKKAGKR